MRNRNGDEGAGAAGRARAQEAQIDEELAHLGVAPELREQLAQRLGAMSRGLSAEAYAAALAGVALADAVRREQGEALERSLRDLDEIQRLLAAFGEELAKLDEALKVLSKAVQRLKPRQRAPAPRRRTLH